MDPEERGETALFGKDANSSIDDRSKGKVQKDEYVPHWNCEPDTTEKWMKDFLRWGHRRKGRLGPKSQVEVLMSVMDDKNFKKAKESQPEDEGLQDDFAAAWRIVTCPVLPHEYKAEVEWKALVIHTSKDMTAEAWVVCWAHFQRQGFKVKGRMIHQVATEHLMEHIYHYRE